MVAGIEGFLENFNELFERADLEMAPWREFVEVWAERHSTNPVRPDDLYALVNQHTLLTEELGGSEVTERSRKTRLGIGLRRYRDRIIAGYHIRSEGEKSHRMIYRLENAPKGMAA